MNVGSSEDAGNDAPTRNLLRRFGPPLLIAVVFGAALFALHHLVQGLDYRAIASQLRAFNPNRVLLAILFTAGSFVALMGYDWSALRYAGRQVPAGVIALASFCGYALGNVLGVAALTGGSVRYRIYGAVGLEAVDIIRISIFCSAAFGIGATAVGLFALTIYPDLLTGVPPAFARIGALSILIGGLAAIIVASRRRKAWRIGSFVLPSPSLTLAAQQLVFSAADLLLSAGVLYVLLPSNDVPFLGFVAIYGVATVAGIISHVPGGAGVFEAVILFALRNKAPADAVAAALLAYRGIYYVLPLTMALALFAAHEVALRWRATRPSALVRPLLPLAGIVARSVPTAAAALALVSGIALLLGLATPLDERQMAALEPLLPLVFIELSHSLASVVGLLLVILAHGLLRRLCAAYWATLGLLIAGSIFSLTRGLDIDQAVALASAALLLAVHRRQFYRPSRLLDETLTPGWFLATAAVTASFVWLVAFSFNASPLAQDLWWQAALEDQAPRAIRGALMAAVVASASGLMFLLRPPTPPITFPDRATIDHALAIVRASDDPDAYLVGLGDKHILFGTNRAAFIMFARHGHIWIALGDPVGDPKAAPDLIARFVTLADRAGGHAAFYQIRHDRLDLYLDLGFGLHKLGEEAVVPLANFDLMGPTRKDLRYTARRAERDGLDCAILPAPVTDDTLNELERISEEWLDTRATREKGFSVGWFDREYLRRCPMAIVHDASRIVAFANLLLTDTKTTAAIDLMRHRVDAPRLTMEYLFIKLIVATKDMGFTQFSLGMAPLAGLKTGPHAPLWNRLGVAVYRHGAHFYNFDGLRQFKSKFDPVWEPRYLATVPGLSPFVAIADTAALVSRGSERRRRALVGREATGGDGIPSGA